MKTEMKNSNYTAGIILTILGILLLMRNFGLLDIDWEIIMKFWPLLLIYAGLAILYSNKSSWMVPLAMVLITILAILLYFMFRTQTGVETV